MKCVVEGKDGLQHSMLVVSEFVGCSPSLSGAIRVNPWSINSVADGIYAAIKLPLLERQMRHEKHWRYVSQHTASYWAAVREPPNLIRLRILGKFEGKYRVIKNLRQEEGKCNMMNLQQTGQPFPRRRCCLSSDDLA